MAHLSEKVTLSVKTAHNLHSTYFLGDLISAT